MTDYLLLSQGSQADSPMYLHPVISYHASTAYSEGAEPPNISYSHNDRQNVCQYTSNLKRYFTWRELVTTGQLQFNKPEVMEEVFPECY